MLVSRSNLAHASRQAEQEAAAAIRSGSEPAARAHHALSLLHVAHVQELLGFAAASGKRSADLTAMELAA